MPGILNWTLVVPLCALVAWRWARVLTVRMPGAVTALVVGVLVQVIAGGVIAWLGLFGVLHAGSQLVCLFILAGLTLLVTKGWKGGQARGQNRKLTDPARSRAVAGTQRQVCAPPGGSGRALRSVASLMRLLSAVAVAMTVLAGALLSLNQIRYISTDADSMFYHLPMVAEWVRSGSIWPAEAIKLVARAYPGFKEAALTALSLPLHNEHLALLAPVEFGLLALVVFCLARHFGSRRPLALAVMAYVVTAPVVANSFVDQGDTDVPVAIATCAAVLFCSMLIRRPTWRSAVLAGLTLGATASVKFSGLIYCGITVTVAMVHGLVMSYGSRRDRPQPAATSGASCDSSGCCICGMLLHPWCRTAIVVLVGTLVVAGPWYARNLLAYGNPLYPAEVRVAGVQVFSGPMSQAEVSAASLGWNIGPLVRNGWHFWEAFGPLVPVVALSTVWLVVVLFSRRQRLLRVTPLLCLPLLLAVAFLHHPYNQPSAFGFDYNMRYLISWFALCACGTAAAIARCRGLSRWAVVILLLGTVWNLHGWTHYWWLLALTALIAGITAVAASAGAGRSAPPLAASTVPYPSDPRSSTGRQVEAISTGASMGKRAVVCLLAGALLGLTGWMVEWTRSRLQYDPGYGYPSVVSQPGWGAIVSQVHRDIRHSRLAVVGDILLFPLYGDDFSNACHPLYEPATAEQLLAFCETQGIDYVAAFAPRLSRGPDGRFEVGQSIARDLLSRYPRRFETVIEDSGSYLLRVVHSSGARPDAR